MTFKELYNLTKDKYLLDDKTIQYFFKYYLKNDDVSFEKTISKKEVNKYFKLINKYINGEPIQYLVGNVDFYNNNFIVKKGVLIPRFETEELVYYTKQYINQYFNKDVSIIDVGTGTGVIGLSLKKEIPNSNVTLVDISMKAIKLAKMNATILGENVEIYQSNVFKEVINRDKKFDVIISNPPYIAINDSIEELVKNNEPSRALYGGKDGLQIYKKILKNVRKVAKDKFLLSFEIGANQAKSIEALVNKFLPESKIIIKKDLSLRDRMMFIFNNLNK